MSQDDSDYDATLSGVLTASVPHPCSVDDKPKLSELQLLEGRDGGKVRVIEGVAHKWKNMATSLSFDGPRIESIDMGALKMTEDACRKMFVKWLDGDHDLKEPVTWATLIRCLIDAGLIDMADKLKEILNVS